jgi:hypothetical protein
MLDTWTCLNPAASAAGTAKDCTFNVYAFFEIVSRKDAQMAAFFRPQGTFDHDRKQMLSERFDIVHDVYKDNVLITKEIPDTSSREFEMFIQDLSEIIGPGKGIPIGAYGSRTGHSFILAVTMDGQICILDPQTQQYFMGIDSIKQYIRSQGYTNIELVYENKKGSRMAPGLVDERVGVRKLKDRGDLKKKRVDEDDSIDMMMESEVVAKKRALVPSRISPVTALFNLGVPSSKKTAVELKKELDILKKQKRALKRATVIDTKKIMKIRLKTKKIKNKLNKSRGKGGDRGGDMNGDMNGDMGRGRKGNSRSRSKTKSRKSKGRKSRGGRDRL